VEAIPAIEAEAVAARNAEAARPDEDGWGIGV
jgi:hypothetical protein